ncbi:MAG: VOC family protein [Betaproteobacteria bacterium]|nr:VOC family protein [Betaproteobacteria bacterium]
MKPQLSHVGIYVRDAEPMIRFYQEVLGLTVTDRGLSTSSKAPIVFMSANPTQHHQFVLVQGRKDDGPSTVNQLSFKVETLDEIRAIAQKVKARGITTIRQTSHGNAWSIYFPDPEGNFIEIYMDTPWHVAQPHGDPMDFSKSDAKIHAWTEKIVRADPTFKPKDAREMELAQILETQ